MFEKILSYMNNENDKNPHLGKIDILLNKEEELSSKTKEVHFTFERGSVIPREIINKKI